MRRKLRFTPNLLALGRERQVLSVAANSDETPSGCLLGRVHTSTVAPSALATVRPLQFVGYDFTCWRGLAAGSVGESRSCERGSGLTIGSVLT
jgi:hypothetical protein